MARLGLVGLLGLIIAPLTAAHNVTIQDPAAACASIAHTFKYPGMTVNFTKYITAGTNVSLDQSTPELVSCTRPSQVVPVDLCRVAMYVATSNRSGIRLEAWLPTTWSGRFLSTGNGGTGGCIQYEDVAYGTSFGFATVGANNGHDGMRGTAFYHNADVVEDFSWRSLYTETIVGKAITKAYYSKSCHKSYYLGCSTGGRQGFKMAQDHPDLFDGIVAGAPALAFNNLSSWSGSFYPITGTNKSATYLTPALWAIVHADILAQCDTLDGAKDGIIEDPSLCTYKPVAIQCASNATNTSSCLTAPQVNTVLQVFSPYYGEHGSLVYPRMQPGSEITAYYLYYNGNPFIYTSDWMRYAILQDPTWDPATMNSTYAAISHNVNPSNIETWKGDLSAFKARGSKIIHYHGQADPIISSDNSPRYYDHVATTMSQSPADLDSFYRFFRISGMGHCTGGNGAWQFGQRAGGATDAEHNVLMKMVEWVEKGDNYAPEYLTGYKYVDGGSGATNATVEYQRRHCKYPKRNRFVGMGNYTDVDGWECVE